MTGSLQSVTFKINKIRVAFEIPPVGIVAWEGTPQGFKFFSGNHCVIMTETSTCNVNEPPPSLVQV